MTSARKVFREFIEKYKELECLWKFSDKDYRNKHKRLIAMEQLIEILRQIDVDANMDTVTKKINSMRSSFNKELNKVKASYRSGSEDIHVPKLWYYDLLLFLVDKETESSVSSDNAAVKFESRVQSLEDSDDLIPAAPVSPYSQSSVASSSVSEQNTRERTTKRSKRKQKTREFLTEVGNVVDASVSKPNKQKYSAFGEHIAEKLRSMPKNMAFHCEKIINEAIYNADFGRLNHTSRIITDLQENQQLVQQPRDPLYVSDQ